MSPFFQRWAGRGDARPSSAWLAVGLCLVSVWVCSGQPAAPSGLTVTNASSTQINLTWNDNSANEQGFLVEQSLDSLTFTQVGSTVTNVRTYAATSLNPAVRYYYRVRAFNAGGNSAYSNTNYATTRTPFAQWQFSKFTAAQLTNAAVSGLTADPDGDGLKNFVEFALNREPLSSDAGRLCIAGTEHLLTDDFPTLTCTGSSAAIDMEITARASTNLHAWSTGASVVAGPIPVWTNGAAVTEKFRSRTGLGAAPQQFLQLAVTYSGVPNSWETGLSMPVSVVEMAAGWLGDKLFVSGMTDAYNPVPNTPMYFYNLVSNTWVRQVPDRPYTGNHHAVEVFGGRLYLLGGCDGGSDGRVQIYDPVTNGWSLGAPMPFPAGACSSGIISNKMYVAGGIVGEIAGTYNGYNTNAAAVYDPISNVWTRLAPIPFGMNHTASGSDGKKLYLFGGRNVGNTPDNGYNTVQIYDPGSNNWASSSDPGSTLAPLPQARGGMGKAMYYNGEFFVMGGETVNGSGATPNHVYNRVDIYNVASNTWRLGTPMLTARHGIYPAQRANRVYIAGGGIATGPTYSSMLEIYIFP